MTGIPTYQRHGSVIKTHFIYVSYPNQDTSVNAPAEYFFLHIKPLKTRSLLLSHRSSPFNEDAHTTPAVGE